MPPSRRALLRTSAAVLVGLAGCSASGEPETNGTTAADPAANISTPETSSPATPTATDEGHRSFAPGPLPDAGWPLPDRSVGRTNYAPTATAPTEAPTAAWTVTPPEPELGNNSFTRPVVADGRLYVGRRIRVGTNQPKPDEHYVHAYDADTGDRRWQVSIPREPNPPALANETLLVDDDATLHALDAATGESRWTFEPAGGIRSALPTPDGVLVVPWRDEPSWAMYNLDTSGREQWQVTLPGAPASGVAWVDGLAFVATSDGVLAAIDTDGTAVAWTKDLQDGEDTVPATLAATSGAVFAIVDGTLYGVSRAGELEWSVAAGVGQLATDGETVFGLGRDGGVHAVAVDGSGRWEQSLGFEDAMYTDGFYDDPAVDGGTLYAGSLDRQLLAIATADGAERWALDLGWGEPAKVATVGATLFAAGGRHLVAYR